jgi:hypothetical protein
VRAWVLAVGGLAVLASATLAAGARDAGAGPRRPGRVVRVPRPPLELKTAVRTCSVVDENRAVCGAAVQIGDVGMLIDEDENFGAATIRAVEPQPDSCGHLAVWMIELELQGAVDDPGHGTLVLDFALDERARKLPPDNNPRDGERVVEVLDSDGDGDLRTTTYGCDQAGALVRTSRPTHICTDTWLSVRGRWQRARSDRSPVCDR